MTTPTLGTAAEVLGRLEAEGRTVLPNGPDLWVDPACDLSPERIAEVKAVKSAILDMLRVRMSAEPTAWLLRRLVNGQRWLTDTHLELATLPGAGLSDPRNAQVGDGLNLWDRLEKLLRSGVCRYPADTCIHGPGKHCPRDAVVICEACVSPGGPQ